MTTTTVRERQTKERLLDAAERLFAQHGYAGTSVRAVTEEAGANLAAVGYHFGSKADLLRAVIQRVIQPVLAEQMQRLDAVRHHGAEGGEHLVGALLDAYVTPIFSTFQRDDEQGRPLSRLLLRIVSDPSDEMQRLALEQVRDVDEQFVHALGRALPHLSPKELWWRFESIIAVIAFDRSAMLSDGWPAQARSGHDSDARAWAITFLTAGLRAPATDSPKTLANG